MVSVVLCFKTGYEGGDHTRVVMRRIVMVTTVVAIGRRVGEEVEVESQGEEVITSHWLPVDKWLRKRGDCKK